MLAAFSVVAAAASTVAVALAQYPNSQVAAREQTSGDMIEECPMYPKPQEHARYFSCPAVGSERCKTTKTLAFSVSDSTLVYRAGMRCPCCTASGPVLYLVGLRLGSG